jgi:N-acetylated-alpha-linked acidic dipeptidase
MSCSRPPRRSPRRTSRGEAGVPAGSLGRSDYVAFVHHAGVASVNLTISGDSGGGIYHSIYDSFAWYSRFSDGQFVYGKAMAQVMATAVARLADAPVLPFEFDTLARAVRSYVLEIDNVAGKKSGKFHSMPFWGAEARREERTAL